MAIERCFSCDDPIRGWKCKAPVCRCREDRRCSVCHAEVQHGAIPNVTGDGVLGGNPRGSKLGDPSPWRENNVKLMEDGPNA